MLTILKAVKKIEITKKSLIYIFTGIALVLLSIAAVDIIRSQKYDAIRINFSGRERMLTQKLSKEILLYPYNQITVEEIEKTMSVFEITLNSLCFGGDIPVDIDMKEFKKIPPLDEADVRNKLLEIISLWNDLKKNSVNYLKTGNRDSLFFIVRENISLLNEINSVVSMIEDKSEGRRRALMIVVFLEILTILLVLAVSLYRRIGEVRVARLEIEKLERFLPICSNCKKIRLENSDPEKQDSWVALEQYFHDKRDISFSHGMCPECIQKLYPDFFDKK